jgi:RNase P subunit RPR2
MLTAFGKKKAPVVICPGCHKPMRAGTAEPILFAKGLSDITYVCEHCGTRTKRTVKEVEEK